MAAVEMCTVFEVEIKRFTRPKVAMEEKLYRMMHGDVEVQAERVYSTVIGHFNCYGVAGNGQKVSPSGTHWRAFTSDLTHPLSESQDTC
jgi:hypothetical protein